MKMQIENTISRIADEARGRFNKILKGARSQTFSAAVVVEKGKAPVKTVSKLGLNLSATSHRTADKVLKQQTKLLENQIDAVANRLTVAASASNVRDLIDTQIRLIPEQASRFVDDTRSTLSIIAGAGQEVGALVKGTVAELRGVSKPSKAKKTRKPAAAKSAKKVARKKAAKKAVKKATSKKAAVRKAASATTAKAESTQQAA